MKRERNGDRFQSSFGIASFENGAVILVAACIQCAEPEFATVVGASSDLRRRRAADGVTRSMPNSTAPVTAMNNITKKITWIVDMKTP
jgi:hypothetical protein